MSQTTSDEPGETDIDPFVLLHTRLLSAFEADDQDAVNHIVADLIDELLDSERPILSTPPNVTYRRARVNYEDFEDVTTSITTLDTVGVAESFTIETVASFVTTTMIDEPPGDDSARHRHRPGKDRDGCIRNRRCSRRGRLH